MTASGAKPGGCIGADTGQIVTSLLTSRSADDGLQVGPLLDRVEGSVAPFAGDYVRIVWS